MKMHALFWAVCALHRLILMPAHSQSLETQERVDAIEGETEAIERELEALNHAATALVKVEEAERRCVAAAEAKSFCECISRKMPSAVNFAHHHDWQRYNARQFNQ